MILLGRNPLVFFFFNIPHIHNEALYVSFLIISGSIVVKSTNSDVTLPGFKFCLHSLITIRPCLVGLSDLANKKKNTGEPVKFKFQINNVFKHKYAS